MLPLVLAVALAAAQAPVAQDSAPDAAREPEPLQTSAQVRALCVAIGSSAPTGPDVLARARALAEHERLHEEALVRRYRMVVPGGALRFAEYDPEQAVLALSERAFLAGAGGALQVWAVEDAGLPVVADGAAVERIVAAAARKALSLELTFVLPEGDDAECGNVPGSDRFSLGVEPHAWAYVAGGQVLARGGAGADHPIVSAAQGARPRVEVSDPVGGGPGLRTAVEGRVGELEGCYRKALSARPDLDGSLVAEVDLTGRRAVRIALDAVHDEAMASCVTAVVARADLPRGADARAAIPIRFELEPPARPR